MKCDSKTVCWTVMVTLLLAWSAGVARGEGDEGGDQGAQGHEGGDQETQGHEGGDQGTQGHEGGDQGTQGHEGGDQGAQGHEGGDQGAQGPIQCYQCDYHHGTCSEEVTGETVQCPAETGCYVWQQFNGDMIRRCGEAGDTQRCYGIGTTTYKCNCNTPLCNKDLDTAGAHTLPCYNCGYHHDTCTDTVHGDIIHCPMEEGCFLGQRKSGKARRGCGTDDNPHCTQGNVVYPDWTNCNCDTPLCNKNLDTAGWNQNNKDPTTAAAATAIVILLHIFI